MPLGKSNPDECDSDMLEIDIYGNSSQYIFYVQKGYFRGFGYPNDAKTPCWLGLWCHPQGKFIQNSTVNSFLQREPV